MKKIGKKPAKKSKVMKVAEVEENLVLNTAGGEMPDPAARNRPLRKDVRSAFAQKNMPRTK